MAGSQRYNDRDDEHDNHEERRGLLGGAAAGWHDDDEHYPAQQLHTEKQQAPVNTWSNSRLLGVAVGVILLLVSGVAVKDKLAQLFVPHIPLRFDANEVLSNGTHEFKRTVLLVSIDGLRADYLDRGLTPHLLDISKQGLRAKSMKPIFPTLTFPNHWALMTGLHAESHGIVANNFWDPASDLEFHYNQAASAWNPDWWFGEPMWETAGKAGLITANLMWPGPPVTKSGAQPTYFVPWKDKVSLDDKLKQILFWLDLEADDKPQLILAYEPSLDQAGHAYGPGSKQVNDTLLTVDSFARQLHDSIEARNLTDIVDIVFVSDHGMTDTSHPELVYIDDVLGAQGMADIVHEDGWPSMGIRFSEASNATHYLDLLLAASDKHPEAFDVYTHATMPERYHFSNNERIAPIYVVPKVGYALTTHAQGDIGMSAGNHGYDNEELSMHAMFVAHGPFSAALKQVHHASSSFWSRGEKQGWHSTADGAYIMDRFPNVEIYNLVMHLLGIEESAAPTNGTVGFWDKYL